MPDPFDAKARLDEALNEEPKWIDREQWELMHVLGLTGG